MFTKEYKSDESRHRLCIIPWCASTLRKTAPNFKGVVDHALEVELFCFSFGGSRHWLKNNFAAFIHPLGSYNIILLLLVICDVHNARPTIIQYGIDTICIVYETSVACISRNQSVRWRNLPTTLLDKQHGSQIDKISCLIPAVRFTPIIILGIII